MKTLVLKSSILLFILSFWVTINFAQTREIKVQVLHGDEVVLDTTIYKTSSEAKKIIENLVANFTTEDVTIDSKLTHGLYVFNITDNNWKQENKEAEEILKKNSSLNTNDIDSLFREFSKEINTQWEMAEIEVFIDSVGSAFNTLKEEIKSMDFENDPNIKSEFEELLQIIRTTKIVIIQEGDTVKFD